MFLSYKNKVVLGAPFLGEKWSGHEAEHSHPSGAEIMNEWICTPIAPYVFV